MKKLLTILLLLTYGICSGQNLVPNGDFEQYWHCPNYVNQLDSAKFWINPTNKTPDYFNYCTPQPLGVNVPNTYYGFQLAHSGVAFTGIVLWAQAISNGREYIEAPLDSTLSAGVCYHFEMYINLGNLSKYLTSDIGVYFSDTAIVSFLGGLLPFTPQISNSSSNLPDTLNWTLVSGNYTSNGGENYLVIGNFDNDANTTTSIVNNSSPDHYAYVFIDDVCLTRCGNSCSVAVGITTYANALEVNVFPNPVTAGLTINTNSTEPTEIILYDISSRKLLQQTFTNTTTINTEQLAKGMYLYTVRNRNGIIKNGKVIKE